VDLLGFDFVMLGIVVDFGNLFVLFVWLVLRYY